MLSTGQYLLGASTFIGRGLERLSRGRFNQNMQGAKRHLFLVGPKGISSWERDLLLSRYYLDQEVHHIVLRVFYETMSSTR
jgi:hypothetical protein